MKFLLATFFLSVTVYASDFPTKKEFELLKQTPELIKMMDMDTITTPSEFIERANTPEVKDFLNQLKRKNPSEQGWKICFESGGNK